MLTRYKGMRRFVRWLLAEGDLDTDPMANLEQPKPKPPPVPVVTDDEIGALLKVTSGSTFEDRRDHAMIRVLLDCGLRISELANLLGAVVDLKSDDVMRVIGKGRKVRVVPFGAKTGRALDRYRKARRSHKYAGSDRFWLGERGPMSHYGVAEPLKVRAAQAGVEDLHAHRFRHTDVIWELTRASGVPPDQTALDSLEEVLTPRGVVGLNMRTWSGNDPVLTPPHSLARLSPCPVQTLDQF